MDLLSHSPEAASLINMTSSYAIWYLAIKNRYWSIHDLWKSNMNPEKSIRLKFKKAFPKIWDFHNKISPPLEHFAFCYSITAIWYWPAGNASNMWEIYASWALLFSFVWEVRQAVERKKILPMQFIWDLTWAALSVQLNNPELIQRIVNLTIWNLLP